MNEKILIVDGEASNIFLLEEILFDYELGSAVNSAEMKKYLEITVPDLILLDVVMPEENGYDLALSLSEIDEYKEIPIIFVTAKITGEDVKKGFDSGGYDYIKKPIEEFELRARIEAVLLRKKNEKKLIGKAITDSLTNMYNRRHFFKLLNQKIEYYKRESRSFSLAMFDIDFFKKINDTFGHLAGDYILKQFSKCILNEIRPYDVAGRYGGEEFVVVFDNSSKKEAVHIVERIKDIVTKKYFIYDSSKIQMTFSCGIVSNADFVEKEITSDTLISLADNRLYNAKESGRNKIISK